MTALIDCHVLTTPADNPAWAQELRADLDAEPVNQHWLPAVMGALGQARAAGYQCGNAPYVSFADPDDRIVRGTYSTLLAALEAHPDAPYAWAGEQPVDSGLAPLGRPTVWPGGYERRGHRNSLTYCHGVVLIRRADLTPALGLLRKCGVGADGVLLAHLARINIPIPKESEPVHLPVVGRLWRQHKANYNRSYDAADRARDLRLLSLNQRLGLEEFGGGRR